MPDWVVGRTLYFVISAGEIKPSTFCHDDRAGSRIQGAGVVAGASSRRHQGVRAGARVRAVPSTLMTRVCSMCGRKEGELKWTWAGYRALSGMRWAAAWSPRPRGCSASPARRPPSRTGSPGWTKRRAAVPRGFPSGTSRHGKSRAWRTPCSGRAFASRRRILSRAAMQGSNRPGGSSGNGRTCH